MTGQAERGPEREGLEGVRSELKRLGYLDHGVERFLLQDALRPRRPLRTLLLLVSRVGLLAGVVLALALTLGLALANGSFATPFDLPLLFLHLLPAATVLAALLFLALCGTVIAVLRLYPVRHIETLALGAALAAGLCGLSFAIWQLRGMVVHGGLAQLLAAGIAAPVAAYLFVRFLHHGLLSLAIRFSDQTPHERPISRRWLGAAFLGLGLLLTLPAVLSARHGNPAGPALVPVAPGERVLLLGIDGVPPEELDYLLAAGDLPHLRSLGSPLAYPRRAELPASFWATVATGLPGPAHGVAALDSFRPAGLATPLARNGPLRAYWARVEVPLGWTEYRPVLATRRSAATVWELASRGGRPVAAVNWWATFPAASLPGLVLAHDGYQLLARGTAGAVAPETARPALLSLAREVAAAPLPASLASLEERRLFAALPVAGANDLLARSLLPDEFYRRVLAARLAERPYAAALYLPGLDIAAQGWSGGEVALADLVRTELQATDRLLGELLAGGGFGTVAVVLDPGRRREGGSGRVLFWRRSGCTGARGRAKPAISADGAGGGSAGAGRPERRVEIAPEQIASGLLRALGLPQSAELPAPPALCQWPAPPAIIAGFGGPAAPEALGAGQGRATAEYLNSLRSLGYL